MNLVLFRSVPLFRNKSYDSWKKPSQFVAQLCHIRMFSICTKYWHPFLDAYSMYESVNKSCSELLVTLLYGGSLGPCKSAYFKSCLLQLCVVQFFVYVLQFCLHRLLWSGHKTISSLSYSNSALCVCTLIIFMVALVLICQMFLLNT